MQISRNYYSKSSLPYVSVVAVLLCVWRARTELTANGYNTKHNLFPSKLGLAQASQNDGRHDCSMTQPLLMHKIKQRRIFEGFTSKLGPNQKPRSIHSVMTLRFQQTDWTASVWTSVPRPRCSNDRLLTRNLRRNHHDFNPCQKILLHLPEELVSSFKMGHVTFLGSIPCSSRVNFFPSVLPLHGIRISIHTQHFILSIYLLLLLLNLL